MYIYNSIPARSGFICDELITTPTETYFKKTCCLLCKHIVSITQIHKHYNSKQCNNGKIFNKIKLTECPYCFINFTTINKSASGHMRWCDKNPKMVEYTSKGINGRQLQTPEAIKKRIKSIKAAHTRGAYKESQQRQIGVKKTPHSLETKQKISLSRRKFLTENPEMVPYKLNHSSKQSYPETYFDEILSKENFSYIKEYQIGRYSLDFAFINNKIDLEIDGDQHYLDQRIVESDVRRTKFLELHGWKIIRIKWSDYKKLDLQGRENYIKNLILQLQ